MGRSGPAEPCQDGEPTNGACVKPNWLPQRGTLAGMSRIVTLVVGVVLALLGVLWILQGLNIVGSSGMSGDAIGAVIGLIIGAVGVFLVVRTLRTPPVRDEV